MSVSALTETPGHSERRTLQCLGYKGNTGTRNFIRWHRSPKFMSTSSKRKLRCDDCALNAVQLVQTWRTAKAFPYPSLGCNSRRTECRPTCTKAVSVLKTGYHLAVLRESSSSQSLRFSSGAQRGWWFVPE
jgi:hypothetical protein